MSNSTLLFEEVASTDFLNFGFGGRSYQAQLNDAIAKTKTFCAVRVELKEIQGDGGSMQVVWCTHNFGFLGGSLGCAEGEKITRAFMYATEHRLPVVVQCRSGGARMQEGTSSLMQMAKVSVAVEAQRRAGLPFVSVLNDPTYGGVSASYAMQSDVRIAVSGTRIGFAGPGVILNTMFEMDQSKYDDACPVNFQSAEYVKDQGQLDFIISPEEGQDEQLVIESNVYETCSHLYTGGVARHIDGHASPLPADPTSATFDYTQARKIDRYQAQDMISTLFTNYVELSGDGRVAQDACIKGGLARFKGFSCVVIGTFKGHTPGDMKATNYGMASPAGYRTALRLMELAERFNLPVVTFVDTCGAWPSFEAERDGQSEAIATNLTLMAGLKVPILSLIIGEGGSGGALGLGMGNKVGMLSQAYFGVISPEGAASILGRYKDETHKLQQFPLDCQELATAQQIYAHQLKEIGVVDEIIWEQEGETFEDFPILKERIAAFLETSLTELLAMSPEKMVEQRFERFRGLGTFSELDEEQKAKILEEATKNAKPRSRPPKPDTTPNKLVSFIANEIIKGERSLYKGLAPAGIPKVAPVAPECEAPAVEMTAKQVLDAQGPEAMAKWVKDQSRVLITDTTMRDAHQSLLATRVRTIDLVEGAKMAGNLLKNAFSFECWGGATFDVAYRFLSEDPWERLRQIRAACPDTCLQMLIRGSNAVGYTSYPDNVIEEFVALAADCGIDIFRVFDCFNDVEQMKVCIEAVRKAGKVAEVCVCYTGDLQTSEIYNLDYYKGVCKAAVDAGAHMIGIKDMAGLLKPRAAAPLINALKEVTDLPIHFHTHATSGAALGSALEMAHAGCDVIDFAIASLSDCTSQPSLNAFLASMQGDARDPEIDYLTLEPLDMYWSRVRDMYVPFENGMKSGTARVYDHEIPGGQYANLLVQCKAMGIYDKWEEVLDMYRDVNNLFGDVVKVTPSSKCVGDLALYLVTRGLTCADVLDPAKAATIDFPASSVGLMEGQLGFPHRGFPTAVSEAILKGKPALTTRPSAALPPADVEGEITKLSETYGRPFTKEDALASLLYPKVFADYLDFCDKNSYCVTNIPTPAFWYGMEVGDTIEVELPEDNGLDMPAGKSTIGLKRIGPVKAGFMRSISFLVNGKEQVVEVKDNAGNEEFEGPMADAGDASHVGSPMLGAVEIKVEVGQNVTEGQVLATVCAMKMEVDVKATSSGAVEEIALETGANVIEGALLMKLKL